MNPAPIQAKRSSTFGIIAIVISIIAFNTPRFLLSMVLIALAAFIIIGFVRDGNKIFSGIATLITFFLFYIMYQSEVYEEEKSNATYSVQYVVTCVDCDVTYTNETGGTDEKKKASIRWQQSIEAKGDEFLHLSAQNNGYSSEVTAKIYINGILMADESSTGDYAIASVSCRAEDVLGKE